jgi:hypothetical protein
MVLTRYDNFASEGIFGLIAALNKNLSYQDLSL